MPDLGVELHDGRAEGILAGDLDVDKVGGALVWGIGWPCELAAQMCKIIAVSCGLDNDFGVLVVLDIGNLLGNAPASVRCSHGSVLVECVQLKVRRGEESRVRLEEVGSKWVVGATGGISRRESQPEAHNDRCGERIVDAAGERVWQSAAMDICWTRMGQAKHVTSLYRMSVRAMYVPSGGRRKLAGGVEAGRRGSSRWFETQAVDGMGVCACLFK